MKTIQYYFQANLFFLLAFGVLTLVSLSMVQAQGEEEELEEGQLPELGVYIPLKGGEGGFVNIRIVEKKFQLYFMDEEKKVIEPVYTSAFIRYENVAKKNIEGRFTLRLSGDGQYLTSGRIIRPPFNLWIFLVFNDSADPSKKIPYGRHRLRQ